jgi:hypothetical protein
MIQSNEKDEEPSEKEIIKVFVITGPKSSGIVTYETEVNGEKIYSGKAWDILEAVKKLPSFKKYKFEYTFSESGYNNYNETVDWVSTGKYDLGLATYAQTQMREGKINYTVPISIDAFALFHYSNTSHFDIFKDVFFKIGYMIMILVILGIISGIILFFLDPQRTKATNIKNRKVFLIRSITTGIATFFGEAGFLFENSSSSIKGLVAITMIMLVAVVFLQFMQAELTSLLIERKMGEEISESDLKTKPVIGHEGYAHTTRWEENGGIVERFKDKNSEELIEIYKKNPNKYIGVVLSYNDGHPFLELYPEITVSVFGNIPSCLIYNPRKPQFGEDLNKGLLHIRATKETQKICKFYFGNDRPNAPPTCTL